MQEENSIDENVLKFKELVRIINANPNWGSHFMGSPLLEVGIEEIIDILLVLQSENSKVPTPNESLVETPLPDELGNPKIVHLRSKVFISTKETLKVQALLEELLDIFCHIHLELVHGRLHHVSRSIDEQVRRTSREAAKALKDEEEDSKEFRFSLQRSFRKFTDP